MPDAKQPSLQLLVKLGSLIVHADEYLSDQGHPYDLVSLNQLRKDEEVLAWIKEMGQFLPQKRKADVRR